MEDMKVINTGFDDEVHENNMEHVNMESHGKSHHKIDGHHEGHDHHDHHGHHHEHEENHDSCNHDHKDECHDHHDHHHEHHNCCGHDHDHDCTSHGHDHDHHHEHHHHDHNEGTKYQVEGFDILETHCHEGATICSFEKMVDGRLEISTTNTEIIDEKIKVLVGWLEEKNAIIGHIKGYINEPEANMTFSTTGFGINYAEHRSDRRKMAFAAIVIGVGEEELKDKVVELFRDI